LNQTQAIAVGQQAHVSVSTAIASTLRYGWDSITEVMITNLKFQLHTLPARQFIILPAVEESGVEMRHELGEMTEPN